MFKQLTNIVKTGAAFLQQGVAPPNTPPEQQQLMADTNHLSSKKFFLALTGFIILGAFYTASVAVLFALQGKGELVGAYTVMYTKCMEVFAVVMATYLGVQAAVDLRYGSSSNATMSGVVTNTTTNTITNLTQKLDVTETLHRAKDDDFKFEDE
jgi:hypothetical protein